MQVHEEGLREHVDHGLVQEDRQAPRAQLDKRPKREEGPQPRRPHPQPLPHRLHGGPGGPAGAHVEGGHAVDHGEGNGGELCVESLEAAEALEEAPVQARAPLWPRHHAVHVVAERARDGEDRQVRREQPRVEAGSLLLARVTLLLLVHVLLVLVLVHTQRQRHAHDELGDTEQRERAQPPADPGHVVRADEGPRQQADRPQSSHLRHEQPPPAAPELALHRLEQERKEHPQPEQRDDEPHGAIDVAAARNEAVPRREQEQAGPGRDPLPGPELVASEEVRGLERKRRHRGNGKVRIEAGKASHPIPPPHIVRVEVPGNVSPGHRKPTQNVVEGHNILGSEMEACAEAKVEKLCFCSAVHP
mmetsp:Transcript_17735/g.36353  ORF Transcript_17735/g.36353 Transcript_17735/m.36353 type:complete len:361 (-) Transcript_17735:240-1322(-)